MLPSRIPRYTAGRQAKCLSSFGKCSVIKSFTMDYPERGNKIVPPYDSLH